MKGRIGKYKDKIVVWGDPNLTAKNEINIDSLEVGGQVDIPVEYYKVVAPEGEDLENVRMDIFSSIFSIFECNITNFNVLVKGTVNEVKLAGVPAHKIKQFGTDTSSIVIYAYALIYSGIPSKMISDGMLQVISSSNIFDDIATLDPEVAQFLKTHLVPITAEEFYNLDDME